MHSNQKIKSSDSNQYTHEGSLTTKKFSRWMKKLIQSSHSDHTRQYIRQQPVSIANNKANASIKPSNESEYFEDNASDNFSVQGMYSIKTANLGEKQGLSLGKYPNSEYEKDHNYMLSKDEFIDKMDTESKVSTKPQSIHNIENEESSRFSDKNSMISDSAASIFGQETINSSLIGIPPQSILDSRRFNPTGSSNRVPVTTTSIASQSVKNYKLFPKTQATANVEQTSSDNHTITSLFSGVGTTTSHFNFLHDRNNDIRSESYSESNSVLNDRSSA